MINGHVPAARSRPVGRGEAEHRVVLRHRARSRRAAELKEDLQAIWAGKLESVIWRLVEPAEVILFWLRDG
jgi:hypothetical protein